MNDFLYIAHRGNTRGPNPSLENKPSYILDTIKKGFIVEVDIWFKRSHFYLGHDSPSYKINASFLKNTNIIYHAKNIEVISHLVQNRLHWFWHDKDLCTLTSQGLVWSYPDIFIEGAILNQPEFFIVSEENILNKVVLQYKKYRNDVSFCGVCSDYVDYLVGEDNRV